MYKLLTIKDIVGNDQHHVIRDDGNGSFTSFPAQEGNPNYEAYLKWLEEGNTPLPADEVTQ
jgi:hypothetical protein